MPTRRANNPRSAQLPVTDYRHATKRKHLPPAGLAASGEIKETPKLQFAYNPHLPPGLRSDPTGKADALPELLREATARKLSKEEAKLLAEALRKHEPWLEWSGKQEKKSFEVEPVALHISRAHLGAGHSQGRGARGRAARPVCRPATLLPAGRAVLRA